MGKNSNKNSRQLSVSQISFNLELVHSCDRFVIHKLSPLNCDEVNYYILPPIPDDHLTKSIIMDGCDWYQYTATYLPTSVALNQPAHPHPNVLAANLDIPCCRYSHLESSFEVTSIRFCSADDHSGIVNRRGRC